MADKRAAGLAVSEAGACAVCTLRCMGLYGLPYFLNAHQTLETEFQIKFVEKNVCNCCEGVLQVVLQDGFMEECLRLVKEADFEFQDVLVTIASPLSLLVRHHSMSIFLADTFPEIYGPGKPISEVTTVKEVLKMILHEKIPAALQVPYNMKSGFKVNLVFENESTQIDISALTEMGHKRARKGKDRSEKFGAVTGPMIASVLSSVSADDFKRVQPCPPDAPKTAFPFPRVHCCQDSAFLAGRYLKFSRELSQTPWVIDGERKTEFSVQDLLCGPMLRHIRADEARFSSAGREDVDVRMLGTGRPFIVELVNPRTRALSRDLLAMIQKEVNAETKMVALRDLQLIEKDETAILKDGEESKTKTYSCIVWTEKDYSEKQDELRQILSVKDLVLKQKTPLRVMHRRVISVREKTIHDLRFEMIKPHFFRLWLSTQAGTYIKEFIHGDFGRTQPNLTSMLGCAADILVLDVEAINMPWPPPAVQDSVQTA